MVLATRSGKFIYVKSRALMWLSSSSDLALCLEQLGAGWHLPFYPVSWLLCVACLRIILNFLTVWLS